MKLLVKCKMEKHERKLTSGQVILHAIGVIIAYLFLIFITGVVAYFYYHPLGAEEGFKQTSELFKNYWNAVNNPNETGLPPLNDTVTTLAPLPSTQCPELEPVCAIEVCNCPAFTETPCPTPPPQEPCIPPVCPAGTCRGAVACPFKPPSIQVFRTADWTTRELPYWYNIYPPLSPERLEVVTSLLDFSYDKFAFDGVLSNCEATAEGVKPAPCEVCSVKDRYDYIDCVMASPIVTNKTDPKYRGSMLPIKSEKGYAWAHALMGHLTAVGPLYVKAYENDPNPINKWQEENASDPKKADPVNRFIEEVIKSYEVTTTDGIVCKVCVAFDPDYWKKCMKKFSLDRQKFTRWL